MAEDFQGRNDLYRPYALEALPIYTEYNRKVLGYLLLQFLQCYR